MDIDATSVFTDLIREIHRTKAFTLTSQELAICGTIQAVFETLVEKLNEQKTRIEKLEKKLLWVEE